MNEGLLFLCRLFISILLLLLLVLLLRLVANVVAVVAAAEEGCASSAPPWPPPLPQPALLLFPGSRHQSPARGSLLPSSRDAELCGGVAQLVGS